MSKNKKLILVIIAIILILFIIITTTTIAIISNKRNDDQNTNKTLTHKLTFSNYKKSYNKEIIHNGLLEKPNDDDMQKEKNLFLGWKEQGSQDFYDFTKPVTKDLVLEPIYYSLDILDNSKNILSEEERKKYTTESIHTLEEKYEIIFEKINDKNISNQEKIKYLEELKNAYSGLILKENSEPITPPISNKVTVTFVIENELLDKQLTKGEKVEKPVIPVKVGYNFIGWFIDEEKTKEFDFETIIDKNITIYAKFERIKYLVTFNLNEGNIDGNNQNIQIKVNHGDMVSKLDKDPTKEDLVFKGWILNDKKPDEKFDFNTKITSNLELIAYYEIPGFVIRFLIDENTTFEGNIRLILQSGEKVQRPHNEPQKENYRFDDWYKNKELTEIFDFNAPINQDTNIYPKFNLKLLTLSIRLEKAEFDGDYQESYIIPYGSSFDDIFGKENFPKLKERIDYTFYEWRNTNNDRYDWSGSYSTMFDDVEIRPVFKKDIATVTFIFDENDESKRVVKQVNQKNFELNRDLTDEEKENYMPGKIFGKWVLENQTKYDLAYLFGLLEEDIVLKAIYPTELENLKALENEDNNLIFITEGNVLKLNEKDQYFLLSDKEKNSDFLDTTFSVSLYYGFEINFKEKDRIKILADKDRQGNINIKKVLNVINNEEYNYLIKDKNNINENEKHFNIYNLSNVLIIGEEEYGPTYVYHAIIGNTKFDIIFGTEGIKLNVNTRYNFKNIIFLDKLNYNDDQVFVLTAYYIDKITSYEEIN